MLFNVSIVYLYLSQPFYFRLLLKCFKFKKKYLYVFIIYSPFSSLKKMYKQRAQLQHNFLIYFFTIIIIVSVKKNLLDYNYCRAKF